MPLGLFGERPVQGGLSLFLLSSGGGYSTVDVNGYEGYFPRAIQRSAFNEFVFSVRYFPEVVRLICAFRASGCCDLRAGSLTLLGATG